MKDVGASALFFLEPLALGGVNSCVVRPLKKPCGETHLTRHMWSLPNTSTDMLGGSVSRLRSGPSSLVGPSDEHSPGCHLDCNLLRDPEPEPQLSFQIPGPQKR